MIFFIMEFIALSIISGELATSPNFSIYTWFNPYGSLTP